MAEQSVAYSSTVLGENEIRVLSLRPGQWTDPVVCELAIVSFQQNPL